MDRLTQEAHDLFGITLTPAQTAALEVYARELEDWNRRVSLTAIRDPDEARVKHFLDSLSCLMVMRQTPIQRVIDVGTGAGFPGLPLKIVCPQIHLTLVESVGKKLEFCRHMVETLGLESVELINARAESVGRMDAHRETYDWALARAVANLPVLVEYLLPLVRIGGRMLAQKGETGPAEALSAENAIQHLGGRIHQLMPLTLPGVVEQRYLVVVDKVAATPEKYPRRVGVPGKRPL